MTPLPETYLQQTDQYNNLKEHIMCEILRTSIQRHGELLPNEMRIKPVGREKDNGEQDMRIFARYGDSDVENITLAGSLKLHRAQALKAGMRVRLI